MRMRRLFSFLFCLVSVVCLSAAALGEEVEPSGVREGAERPASSETTAADADEEAFLGSTQSQTPKTGPTGKEEGGLDVATSEEGKNTKKDHEHQGFVSIVSGLGWYFVAPYDKDDEEKACGKVEYDDSGDPEGDPFCTGRSGMYMDFLGGFGVKEGFEVFAIFRLGLERANDFLPERTRMLGFGIKGYTPSDGLFKLSIGVAPLFDFSSRKTDKKDFVIHVPIAAHFDILRWLGIYLQLAPNISFISEFKFDITLGLGIQGRFP